MGKSTLSPGLFQAAAQPCIRGRFRTLAAANATSVAALHSIQAISRSVATSFPDSSFLWLLPTMALTGYASGVAMIAFGQALHGRSTLECHLGFLVLALTAASIAPDIVSLATASFGVGVGAAVAPRLLASATQLVRPAAAGGAIGRIICGSLVAILCVRLLGDSLASVAGWRSVFLGLAASVAALVVFGRATRPAYQAEIRAVSAHNGLRALWQSYPLLRRSCAQQATLFAAYNGGWMTALAALPDHERRLVVIGGSFAGIIAALVAGPLSDRAGQQNVVKAGAAAMLVAGSLILPAAYNSDPGTVRVLLLVTGMALVDAGLQIALVANQTRVQALDPGARARLAATLTISGFLGGAIGAGAASWLWYTSGWRSAVGVVAVGGCLAFACSLFADVTKRPERSRSGEAIPILGTTNHHSITRRFSFFCRQQRLQFTSWARLLWRAWV